MQNAPVNGKDMPALGRDHPLVRSQGNLGFTLLEVLVAITILTIGLLALARMQTQAVQSNSFGNQLTEATFLAQDKAEELRLLNTRYQAVIAKPQATWTSNDQSIATDYNNQLADTQDNWIDSDSDTIADSFNWNNPDHTNSDGPDGIANPITATGVAAATGGYTREWCVVDDVPVVKAKTVHVRVRWGNNRQVVVQTVLSE